MSLRLNTAYFTTSRGAIKITQIILGIVIASVLCTSTYDSHYTVYCYNEPRLGYVSVLNIVTLIINIVILILVLFRAALWKIERFYSVICTVLFLIACGLIIWFVIEFSLQYQPSSAALIATTVCVILMAALYIWDVRILQGEAAD
ncbi:Protein M60.4 b [Aphelenchoides avenae]|nr:Protein M60.4 b [Aphelenchus avenae]